MVGMGPPIPRIAATGRRCAFVDLDEAGAVLRPEREQAGLAVEGACGALMAEKPSVTSLAASPELVRWLKAPNTT
jgi:hypothetical protein